MKWTISGNNINLFLQMNASSGITYMQSATIFYHQIEWVLYIYPRGYHIKHQFVKIFLCSKGKLPHNAPHQIPTIIQLTSNLNGTKWNERVVLNRMNQKTHSFSYKFEDKIPITFINSITPNSKQPPNIIFHCTLNLDNNHQNEIKNGNIYSIDNKQQHNDNNNNDDNDNNDDTMSQQILSTVPSFTKSEIQNFPNIVDYLLPSDEQKKKKYQQEIGRKSQKYLSPTDIVFAYINNLQRTLLFVNNPYHMIPVGIQTIILNFYLKVFQYQTDFDVNGIIYWLGTNYGLQSEWINPAIIGTVKMTSDRLMHDSQPIHASIGRKAVRCVLIPMKNTWIMIDFNDICIAPTHYTLRHYESWDIEALRNWRLEASNNSTTGYDGDWYTISEHTEDTSLNGKGSTNTWQIFVENDSFGYSQFRILQHGLNSNRHWYLALSGFEIYGTVFAKKRIKGNSDERDIGSDTNGKQHDTSSDESDIGFDKVKPSKARIGNIIDMINEYGWNNDLKSDNSLIVSSDGVAITNIGSDDKWRCIVSKIIFKNGRHSFDIEIINDGQTNNKWRVIIGVVPINFDPKKKAWIGSQNSWGYVGGTGGKCHQFGKSTDYGESYGVSDVIKCIIDFNQKTIEFLKNGVSQGIAFNNLNDCVSPAISLTGMGSCVRICNVN